MDRFDDDTLLAELRELRPTPSSEFTHQLDERAAAGFPRRPSRAPKGPFGQLAAHFRDLSGGRWMVPAVGLTIAVLAAVGVVVAIGSGSGGSSVDRLALRTPAGESSAGGAEMSEAGGEEAAGAEAVESESTSHAGELPSRHAKAGEKAPSYGAAAGGAEHSGEAEAEAAPAEAEGEASIEEAPAEEFTPVTPFTENAPAIKPRSHRDVERSSTIVLGTKPDQVAGAAAKVYSAVHAADGVVLDSSVESGTTGATGASFTLLIPSAKVDDALASISQIAEVRSRHDATNDITAPTVGVTEELRDSNASIEGLLKELGDVETEAERESVEARLHEERRRHASIRASIEHLHKRAAMSEVSVRIVTGHGAGAVPVGKGKSGGDWSVGDALHDAGHILTIIAGVALIALAILAPIALIGLLIWSLNRFRVRRLRERALG